MIYIYIYIYIYNIYIERDRGRGRGRERQSVQNQNLASTRSSVLKLKHSLRNTCSCQKSSYLTPIVWNNLQTDLKLANSRNNFKHKLKDHFLKKLKNMEQNIFAY